MIPSTCVGEGDTPAKLEPLLNDSFLMFETTNDAYISSDALCGNVLVFDLALMDTRRPPCLPVSLYTFSDIMLVRELTPNGASPRYSLAEENGETNVSS